MIFVSLTSWSQISLTDDETVVNEDYNLRFGELYVDFAGSVTASFDSNVNYRSGEEKENGTAIVPGIETSVFWALSPYVTLDAGANIRYRNYLDGDGNDSLLIEGRDGGNSADLDLEFLLGDDSLFTFSNSLSGNSDTFSRTINSREAINDNYTAYFYSGMLDYAQRITPYTRLNLGLFRNYSWTEQDDLSFNDYTEDGVEARINSQIRDDMTLGVKASASKVDYEDSLRNEFDLLFVGLEFSTTTEAGAIFTGTVGAQNIDVDIANDPLSTDDGGWFPSADVQLTFNVGQFVSHEIGVFSGAGAASSIALSQDLTQFSYPNFAESYGGSYALDYLITENMVLRFSYEYNRVEESDAGLEYKDHRLELGTSVDTFEQGSVFVSFQYQNRFDANVENAGFVRYLLNGGLQFEF